MSEEPDEDRSSFWNLAGLWQQIAAPFPDLRAFEDFSTWGSRTALDALFESVRTGLVGRRVEVGQGLDRVAFTLSSLDARLEPVAASAGQADDVRLRAVDAEWATYRFLEVKASLGNLHTRLGMRPSLVSAPIDLSVAVSGEQVSALLAARSSRWTASLVDSSRVRLHLARHPTWGWVECRPSIVGGRVRLQPTGLGRAHRLCRFKRRLPSVSVQVEIPDIARIVDLEVGPDRIEIHLRIDQWRVDYKDVLGLATKSR